MPRGRQSSARGQPWRGREEQTGNRRLEGWLGGGRARRRSEVGKREGVTAVWEEGREDLARYHVTMRARYHVTVRETLTLIRVGNTLI